MEPLIFAIVFVVLIVAIIALAAASFARKKKKIIANGLSDGTISNYDICFAGTLKMNAGTVAKEAAKSVATAVVGALFGVAAIRSFRPTQVIMVLGLDRILLFAETRGAFSNSFDQRFDLRREMIQSVSIDRQAKNKLSLTVRLQDGHTLGLYVRPFKKDEAAITRAVGLLNTYHN
ncbi:MAG: hypothetical protein LBT55_03540 [Clostridiaceae bacterium]|jgi:hypothetical protein|nr:hypothetical protein [Clostridiaceae bacterium]